MSEGIDIPFKLSGADAAKIALDAVIASFTGLEREVLKVAEKSDTAKGAFDALKQKFAEGAITADEMRASLARIAEQAPKVGTSVKGAMAESARGATGLRDALVNVKDAGLHELSQKAGELGQRLGGVTGQVAQVAIRSLAAFGPVGVALTGVGAALAFATQAYEQHRAAVELANAKVEALTTSEQNLGAAYPSVASAVAGATTAVEAHTRAIEEQQRVLGQQLTLMGQAFSGNEARQFVTQIQQVAGAARELGTFLRGASEDQIRSTLETGNATQQMELLGLSFAHSSNAVEEHQRRLDAIIVLQHRAAEAVAEHKDELVASAQAQLAEARAEAEAARDIDDNGTAHAAAMRRVEAAANALATAQNRAAEAHRNAAAGAQDSVRALDELDAATRAQADADQEAALQRGYAAIRRIAQRRHSSGGARAQEPGKSSKADDLATDRLITAAYTAEREALERLRETEQREADARDALHRTELDRLTERQRAQEERAKAESVEGARAQRAADREHRLLQRRLDATQSFNERMRDLYEGQVDIAREGAEGVARTFSITGDALAKHAEAWAAGRETIGDALQGMLSDVLTSIGKESFVKAAFFFAKGLGDLASYNFPGAAQSFAASAAYGVVGGLATAAGAAVAPSAAPSASGASTAPAAPAARVSKGSASSGSGEGTIINVAFGGPMYGTGGVRRAAREIAGVLNGGARQGGVQLMPGALMGGGAGS